MHDSRGLTVAAITECEGGGEAVRCGAAEQEWRRKADGAGHGIIRIQLCYLSRLLCSNEALEVP